MEDLGFLIAILILSMDISAAVLGIEAEIAQNKEKHSSSAAFSEGIAAIVLLCVAHVTANVLGGCVYLRSKQAYKKASANKRLAVIFLFLSWISIAVALPTLVIGTVANSNSHRFRDLSHHWMFLVGGIFCIQHGLVTAAYYVSAIAAEGEEQ